MTESVHINAVDASLISSCFAPGTPIRVPGGFKTIEDIKEGDYVLARDEHRPDSPAVKRKVELVFHADGQLCELTISGRTIRTTPEHRFHLHGGDWVAAKELQPGSQLTSLDGPPLTVDSITPLLILTRVHNMRVAEDHTYFVGEETWDWSVWAHNECGPGGTQVQPTPAELAALKALMAAENAQIAKVAENFPGWTMQPPQMFDVQRRSLGPTTPGTISLFESAPKDLIRVVVFTNPTTGSQEYVDISTGKTVQWVWGSGETELGLHTPSPAERFDAACARLERLQQAMTPIAAPSNGFSQAMPRPIDNRPQLSPRLGAWKPPVEPAIGSNVAPNSGRWIGSTLSPEATEAALLKMQSRMKALKEGSFNAIDDVGVFGSRGGSTFRGRGPIATSDLDIAVKDFSGLNGSRHYDNVVMKLKTIADDFTKETGIQVQLHLKSAYNPLDWMEKIGF